MATILGIDEVGRGPLAGPLVVGAVVLPEEKPEWVADLKDSKKLSAKKREALAKKIKKQATFGLGWVSAADLDEIGISEALKRAAKQAVREIQGKHTHFSEIVIDGKVNFLADTALEEFVTTKVKADNSVKEVSAASIVAKVARDRYMVKLSQKYPGYGFEKNVGYGTAAHMAALDELGPCPEHRKSFEPIKSMVGWVRQTKRIVSERQIRGDEAQRTGVEGEEAAANYLARDGHLIIERNFKTQFCEIDIVSAVGKNLYFTEVKTNKSGRGLQAITFKKYQRMKFGAMVFLKEHPEYDSYEQFLAVASVMPTGNSYRVLDWFIIQ